MLAPFACDPAASRGRQHPQAQSATRDAFQRDRDRIVHCSAFRRLRDKTQVFVAPDGDHFRVRLTHSLEVAQIARTLARALHLNEDLTEAIALAHDLGHPPFGHSGEDALEACMLPYGGFDHNAQTLRIVMRLEHRYPGFDGLNLSWETLEGLAKHNGPVTEPGWALAECDAQVPLDLATYASLEAQVAAIADDIAYDNHDLDDGLRAGLFTVDEVLAVSFAASCWTAVTAQFPNAPLRRLIPELIREQIGRMVDDLLAETRARVEASHIRSAQDARSAGETLVAFSPTMAAAADELKTFLRSKMYSSAAVSLLRDPSQLVVARLFDAFHADAEMLPERWRVALPADEPARARHVGDFIAGMTDRYALRQYERVVGTSPLPAGVSF